MQTQQRTLEVNGTLINVVIDGAGPDVLLLHGFPDDHRVWRRQILALVSAGYRVIAMDTRGCGESAVPEGVGEYRLDKLVADVVGVLDALAIDRVRLVAHDWGAVIGWQLALAHPERVDRYVALSVGHPNAYARGGLRQKLKGYYVLLVQLRGIAEFLLTLGNWLMFRLMTRYPAEFDHWRASLSRPGRLTAALNYYRANLGLLLRSNHPPARVPVLGVWSSRDIALTEGQMANSRRYVLAHWQYRRIEGASHWLQLDAAESINTLLLEYLQ